MSLRPPPKVSVVMASYNHEAFVREAIESVLSQSYQDLELVITDDGSSDGTAKVIQSVPDPRIRLYVFKENQGACVAVNDAIARASGEYIAVLNSDDYFLPGKLERQVAFLEAHPEIGAVFGLPLFVDERGARFHNRRNPFVGLFTDQNRSRIEWLRHFFYHGNSLCHPTILIRKSCYDAVGLFDPLLMQLPDLDLWIRLCRKCEIYILPEQLTGFRILDREKNTSAPNTERLARAAWETNTVLEHFAGFSDGELQAILSGSRFLIEGRPLRIVLAMEALALGKPGYKPFGLNLLRRCLMEHPNAMPAGEYFQLVGRHDPFSTEFFRREHQWLKRSRFVSALRQLYARLRAYNFGR